MRSVDCVSKEVVLTIIHARNSISIYIIRLLKARWWYLRGRSWYGRSALEGIGILSWQIFDIVYGVSVASEYWITIETLL